MRSKFLIIAHRGASHILPENTLPAFRKALQLGANGLELDVHLSKDGYPVVIHDEKVNRTTNGKGFVKQYTLKELKELSAGGWFHPRYVHLKIPTLEEILIKAKRFPTMLIIELKNALIRYDGIEKEVIRLIQKHDLRRQTIVSSFNPASVQTIASIDEKIATGFLYFGKLDEPWLMATELGARAIHPPINALSRYLTQKCRGRGLFVYPYHVNHWRQIRRALDCQVDGLITMYPEKVRKFVE